jgi:hypothetical protein
MKQYKRYNWFNEEIPDPAMAESNFPIESTGEIQFSLQKYHWMIFPLVFVAGIIFIIISVSFAANILNKSIENEASITTYQTVGDNHPSYDI